MLIRRRQPKRSRFSWRVLAFEVFAVVLGVTLALGAAEVRQHFLDARRVEVATESLAAEMEQNCRRIERSQAYHERVIAELDSVAAVDPAFVDPAFMEGDAMDLLARIPSWRGFNSAFVTGSAYATAQATGALGLMSYEQALGLGNYYTFVDSYRQTVRDAMASLLAQGGLSAAQLATGLQLTFELERELGPSSCAGARQLRGEPAVRDSAAAGS
ncbi:MAG: hypothetical protein AAGI91_10920 [Bacteroidota bacterium]